MPEMLPPLTFADLKNALGNPGFTVYVYIGGEKDEGWEVANDAFGLMPAMRIYLVKDRAEIAPLLKGQPGTVRAIVFGYTKNPKQFLTKTQAEDLKVVTRAIADASG